jgi:diadenosine tetraphosphate (Ap4A) HIT family hydrolase
VEAGRAGASGLVAAVPDRFPVSPGHTLIVPLRHVAGFFDLTEEELAAALDLLRRTADDLRASHSPAGFNIGVNDGAAAGQTIPHVHLHLIPRYAGDAEDPRGGIRWVLPAKAVYWEH